ncbi:MAG: hypothetical protein WA705_08045 [Candidatus Ozemobacteraceae bacterium]
MNIFLNGEALDLDENSPDSTVGELIDLLEPELDKRGRTLVEIIINGVSYAPDQREAFDHRLLAELEKVELIGVTSQELLQDAIKDGPEAFSYLEGLALEIASSMRIGNVKEAMERHVEFVDGLDWMSMVLQQLSLGFAAKMTENTLEERRQRLLKRFTEHMAGLKNSQENKDWVGLADILEYEFPDLFKEGRQLFEELQAGG